MKKTKEDIYTLIQKVDKNITGNIAISETNKLVLAYGKISTSKKEQVEEVIINYLTNKYPNKLPYLEIKYNQFTVLENGLSSGKKEKDNVQLDEIEIIYSGSLKTSMIVPNETMKLVNPKNKERMNNAVRVMDFIAPIILNQNLEVIDGQLRLELALENNIKEVPVIILNTTEIQEKTLRLVLNRSSEFQRWNWVDIDNFIDDNPQIQPIMEPLGLFGRYVLPESFFTDTVIQYEIDPFNGKQMAYDQEWGLAKWAEIRRNQMKEALEAKKQQKKKVKSKPKRSLFDLTPTKDDFLETYDANEELDKFNEKWKNKAIEISAKKDIWSKERKEKLGQEWQLKVRSNKEFSDDRKEKFVQKVIDSELFTEDELNYIFDIDKLVQFKNLSPKEIREKLDEDNNNEEN